MDNIGPVGAKPIMGEQKSYNVKCNEYEKIMIKIFKVSFNFTGS